MARRLLRPGDANGELEFEYLSKTGDPCVDAASCPPVHKGELAPECIRHASSESATTIGKLSEEEEEETETPRAAAAVSDVG